MRLGWRKKLARASLQRIPPYEDECEPYLAGMEWVREGGKGRLFLSSRACRSIVRNQISAATNPFPIPSFPPLAAKKTAQFDTQFLLQVNLSRARLVQESSQTFSDTHSLLRVE